MSFEQAAICLILVATLGMFLWGRWRHDMVAMGALLVCVLFGLVVPEKAFEGFGHPAVVTVACVLVLSRALQVSGAVNALARRVIPLRGGPTLSIGVLAGLGALLSAFMNNVGALALLMPIAIQLAAKQGLPPGRVLMPLAFGSILGGMTTLIGTPPNLIVSGFRAEVAGQGFAMFDFSPVGLAVASAGLLFVALIGWRLVPSRERAGMEGFATGAYITEARLGKGSKSVGKSLVDLGPVFAEADASVIGLVRGDRRSGPPPAKSPLMEDDILVIEAEPEGLAGLLLSLELVLEESMSATAAKVARAEAEAESVAEAVAEDGEAKAVSSEAGDSAPEETEARAKAGDESSTSPITPVAEGEEVALMELTVRPETPLVGRSASDLLLRTRYGINLLALSRRGKRSIRRLRSEPIEAGDVLLMQGTSDAILGFASEHGCVPLAERSLRLPDRREAPIAVGVMAAAVGGAAFGLLPAAISFAAGVLVLMATRVVSLRNVYEAIDWPVVVLLGALIPVAGAMEATGAADLLADLLISTLAGGRPVLALGLILVVTMTLSDFMNNAATAAVMCPIAISTAAQTGTQSDPFLMAVAIGASCAFLTPIGHQNNTLILGPGGFRFGDYWRLGLPLEFLVVAISLPTLLLFWPL
jgi:di/tricarboxylate transporter